MGSILYIKECPPKGGDTLFASMYAAYECAVGSHEDLSRRPVAVHDGESVYRGTLQELRRAGQAGVPARRCTRWCAPIR
jgi:taurine dioxygenase